MEKEQIKSETLKYMEETYTDQNHIKKACKYCKHWSEFFLVKDQGNCQLKTEKARKTGELRLENGIATGSMFVCKLWEENQIGMPFENYKKQEYEIIIKDEKEAAN